MFFSLLPWLCLRSRSQPWSCAATVIWEQTSKRSVIFWLRDPYTRGRRVRRKGFLCVEVLSSLGLSRELHTQERPKAAGQRPSDPRSDGKHCPSLRQTAKHPAHRTDTEQQTKAQKTELSFGIIAHTGGTELSV